MLWRYWDEFCAASKEYSTQEKFIPVAHIVYKKFLFIVGYLAIDNSNYDNNLEGALQ